MFIPEMTATLNLSITSEVAKYDIQSWLAILGFLFGSGVIIEVGKKIFGSSSSNSNGNNPT
jgi:hypothetical protein